MKTLIIILLFSLNLFAQEVISVSKGSGSYTYTVATDTNQIVNGDLYLYGTFTRTQVDTGAYSFHFYIVWKYAGGVYDSSAALRIANSLLVRVNAPILDTTGTYYASVRYKTKNGNWIYSRGIDSTFTTPVTIIPPDTVPVQFTFHDSTGAEYSTLVESNGVTLLGLDSCWAYAGGASFKVNAGAWRTAGIKVFDSDVLYLRATSSAVCTTAVNTTLTVGGVSDIFSITTKLDNTPSAFTFTDKTGAEVSTLYTSNQITVAGINCASAISINGGQFQIDANAWRSLSTTVANGSLVRVRNTSSANYNTAVTSILTIGGVQDTYTITTRADTTPVQFTFTDVTNAHLDSLYTSNGVALSSLDSCNASAGLDTFKVGVYGAWFVGMKKVYGNDTIYLKNVSSGSYSSAENMVFSAGGITDTWSITTIPDPNPPPGNNWYVDGVLTGTDNGGTSWADAWEDFSQINWASIEPGDRLYISGRDAGGANDSTVYYETLSPQCRGTATNRITIIAGKYSPSPSGHSGRVIIDGQGATRDWNISFVDDAATYVTVKGFECREAVGGVRFNVGSAHGTCMGIMIDSCYIYDFYDLAGVLIIGNADSTIIQNNLIKTFINDGTQTDCIHLNGDGAYYPILTIIRDNVILNMNQDPNAHNDAIQSVLADGVIIYNNIVINDSVYSPEGGGMPFILSSTDLDYNDYPPVIAFNNFLWMGGAWWGHANDGAVFRSRHDGIGQDEGAQSPNYIFNNTFVCSGPRMDGIDQEWTIRLFINNIIAMYCKADEGYPKDWRAGVCIGGDCTNDHGWYSNIVGGSAYEAYSEIDSFRTNVFWRQDSIAAGGQGGAYRLHAGNWMHAGTPVSIGSWANWDTYDASNSLFRDPKFVSNFGETANHEDLIPDVKAGSPVIGAGESLRYLYNYFKNTLHFDDVAEAMLYDIYGNPRDIDNPSIGAYEYAP